MANETDQFDVYADENYIKCTDTGVALTLMVGPAVDPNVAIPGSPRRVLGTIRMSHEGAKLLVYQLRRTILQNEMQNRVHRPISDLSLQAIQAPREDFDALFPRQL